MAELREGLRKPEGIGTLQEDQQSQLAWTLGGSQRLTHQPKPNELYTAPASDAQLGLHVGPPASEVGRRVPQNLWRVCGFHFPTGTPCLASVGEDVPNPQ